MAERFGTRPSALLDVRDPYEAYCLDEAIHVRSVRFESEQSDDERHGPPDSFAPPSPGALALIPWAGDGPDPLERTAG